MLGCIEEEYNWKYVHTSKCTHYQCKFFVRLPWQTFQHKQWHKQHSIFPYRVSFLSHIAASVFVIKEALVWLFNKLDRKAMQMITRKGLGLFFSVLGLLEAESFLWHDVLCCHTNNCPQPKWGMAQRKKWVTKTQRTLGSTLITIYLEASSRHRNTPLPPIKMLIKNSYGISEDVTALSRMPVTLSRYLKGKYVPELNTGAALHCIRKSLWLLLGITWLTFYDWLKQTDGGLLGVLHRVIHKPTKIPARKSSHHMQISLCLINIARNPVGKFPAVRHLTCDNLPQQHS